MNLSKLTSRYIFLTVYVARVQRSGIVDNEPFSRGVPLTGRHPRVEACPGCTSAKLE